MSGASRIPDSPNDQTAGAADPDQETRAVIAIPGHRVSGEEYDVGQLFLEWAWEARFPEEWEGAVRALARTLRGLEGAGLIERRTIRRSGAPTHHGFVLTELGRRALHALSGDWIKETGE
jgi:hypothetical protein